MSQSVRRDPPRRDKLEPLQQADRDTVLYIAAMAGELKGMAEKSQLRTLTYLLDLVHQEASLLAFTAPSR